MAQGVDGGGLLERDRELERIGSLIDAARDGHGALLLVDGPPGIGKSALLTHARRGAADRGLCVLAGHGAEGEVEYPFGLVRQLFSGPLASLGEKEQGKLLAGAAGITVELLTGETPSGPPSGRDRVVPMIHGLYSLASALARRQPLLIVVDDCHWADAPSLRFLLHLSRRLDGLSASMLTAARTSERSGERGAVAELAAAGSVITPGPLSVRGVSILLERELGLHPADAFAAGVRGATGGNPFLLRTLTGVLREDGIVPSEHALGLLDSVGPQTISRAALLRLSRQHEGGAALARALAVLGNRVEMRHGAALAHLDATTAAHAADALRSAHILSANPVPEFEHPIVRSAIYADIPAGRRSLMHREAATLLAADGASVERLAQHYLHIDPSGDQAVVDGLMQASEAALQYGAPEAAVAYLERARDEPPLPAAQAGVLHALGRSRLLMRDPRGIADLEEAARAAEDPVLRAHIECELVEALVFAARIAPARDLARRALAGVPPGAEEIRLRLLSTFAAAATVAAEDDDYGEEYRQLRELVAEGGPHTRAPQLLLCALDAFGIRECSTVEARIERALDGGRLLRDVSAEAWPLAQAAVALISVDALAAALSLTDDMEADALERASVLGLAAARAHRGLAHSRQGELTAAEVDLRAALELSLEHQILFTIPFCFGYLVDVLIERDSATDITAMLEAIPVPEEARGSLAEAMWLEVRGRVRLSRGDASAAVEDLRSSGDIWEAMGICNPNISCWRSGLALALGERSKDAVALAESELELASTLGSPRAIGVARRALGLIQGGDAGRDQLEQAVARHREANAPLELSRSLFALGAAMRRANERTAARAPLREALDLAVRCDATVLSRRADEELRASGARPRRPSSTGVGALTPAETRVVRLAAGGLSNPEIAQALFVTINTVESHLRNAYRKLDVRSRSELAPLVERAESD